MEIEGKIIKVFPLQTGISQKTNNTWAKQTYVLETIEQYPKHCAFDVFGTERIQNLAIREGEILAVSFSIDAHEYNGRWFNNITAFKVDRPAAQPTTQTQAAQGPIGPIVPPAPTVQQTAQQATAPQPEDNNLPF